MKTNINFGVFLPFYAFQDECPPAILFTRLRDTVLECERLGYHSVWLDDHLMYGEKPILECWTTLAALSSLTKHIRLGTMVTCNSFRNPALLAKIAATLDIISAGRLEFGIGAGIQKTEHNAYGFSFPNSSIRIERLSEAIQVIKALWSGEKVSYNGKHYSVKEAVCQPIPLQKPHPPITVGGSGEALLMRVTAKHADRYDWGYIESFNLYKHKLQVLEIHCKAVGRDFSEIEKSCWPGGQVVIAPDRAQVNERIVNEKPKSIALEDFKKTSLIGTPEECIQKLQPYVDLGVKQCMLFFGDLPNFGSLRLFADTVARKFDAAV